MVRFRHSPYRHRAFTLIELLVVIGIMGLLISILLPALNRAREQANAIKCASNMRQLFAYTTMYLNDNKGMYPVPPTLGDGPPPATTYPVAWYMDGTGRPGIARFDQGGTLLAYMPPSVDAITGVFNCPTDISQGRPVRYAGNLGIAERNFTYSFDAKLDWCFVSRNYAHTYTANGSTHNTPAIKASQVRHPANKLLIVEEEYPNDGMCELLDQNGNPDADDVPTKRHTGYCNICFADGHIDRATPADVYAHAATGTATIRLDEWFDLFK